MSSAYPPHPAPASTSDSEDTTTIYTPPATLPDQPSHPHIDHALSTWIPSNGRKTIIRSPSSGNLLTLLDGEIVLAPLCGRGAIHWTCVEFEGWFGFRSTVTGKYLCHVSGGQLKCTAEEGQKWRHFTITPVAGRGYIMQMLDWWTLRPVVVGDEVRGEGGGRMLGRWGEKLGDGVVWEFIEVV